VLYLSVVPEAGSYVFNVRVARIGSDAGAGVVEGAEAGSSGLLALVLGFGLRDADFEGLEGSRRVYFVVIRVCEGSEGLSDWEKGLLNKGKVPERGHTVEGLAWRRRVDCVSHVSALSR